MSFLASIATIFLCALILGSIFKKIKLPPLIGMLIVGIVLGPYVLNLINGSILLISSDLRQLALIIILTRAGLTLKLSDLKKVGRPAILLSFVPAVFEIVGYIIFSYFILHLSVLEGAILGCVMSAVSPAVVVPRMIFLQSENYGTDKNIPSLITAGSSMDDVFVIVLFTAFIGMTGGSSFNFNIVWQVPCSIILGILIGFLTGYLFSLFFKKFHIRDTVKIIVFLSFSFLFVSVENILKNIIPFSGLIAVICLGISYNFKDEKRADRLSSRYDKIWVFAELLLFVLVGAEVNISFALNSFFTVVLIIVLCLIFRTIGVFMSLIRTNLNFREKLFCSLAYIPKATVQAAIGALPLSLGLSCGNIILTFAVVSILVTAPLGAFATDFSYKRLLNKEIKIGELKYENI